jgi:N-acetylmuramoyl-L-alanine amidase
LEAGRAKLASVKLATTCCVLMAVAVAGAAPRHRARHAARAGSVSGQQYVRLTDWAKANGFEARWLKPDETLQLTDSSTKLLLAVDSRQAEVNGVEVWLLFPVVLRDGAACLTQLDAQQTLRPLLLPPKAQPGTRIKTVCLDPGHGGKDPGNEVGSHQEKRYTLLLARALRKQLSRSGLKVLLTRSKDTFVELSARPEFAKRHRADLFLSLHFNAADTGRDSVQGAEVYCMTPVGASSTNARGEGRNSGWYAGNRHNAENLLLAYQVQKALTQTLGVEDRGVRRARFAVLRDAAMPAVLIEAGFMSHPREGRKIFSSAYRQELAHAIAEGVLAYKAAVEGGA